MAHTTIKEKISATLDAISHSPVRSLALDSMARARLLLISDLLQKDGLTTAGKKLCRDKVEYHYEYYCQRVRKCRARS